MDDDVPYDVMTDMEGTAFALVQQSKDKLEAVAEALKPWISNDNNNNSTVQVLSCATTQPQHSYRCKCSFQLLLHENVWRYAIRRDKQPIIIDSFPIANRQIQKAMQFLLKCSSRSSNVFTQYLTSISFSSPWKDDDDDIDSHSSSSGAVVVVTLHYVGPIADKMSWKEQARHICHTSGFSQLTGRSKKVIVRAFQEEEDEEDVESNTDREVRVNAMGNKVSESISSTRRRPSSIYDTMWLEKTNAETTTSSSTSSCWNVSFLNNPEEMTSRRCTKDDDNDDNDGGIMMMRIPVHYCKPEGAFFHPNASVMMLALKWLLNRVQYIIHATTNTTTTNAQTAPSPPPKIQVRRRPRLLELYCGCGAHTMPLALSRLLSHITALELDERLVRALKHNCLLNNLVLVDGDNGSSNKCNSNICTNEKVQKDNDGNHDNDNKNKNDTDDSSGATNHPQQQQPSDDGLCTTVVECISSDAGTWAREQQQRQQKRQRQRQQRQDNNDDSYRNDDNDDDLDYDILLVDPPRNGLDEQVCQLALGGETSSSSSSSSLVAASSFSHILYISCGKQALVRDLERLSAGYELVDCAILDLFPQTEAVETLVHLQRR